MFLLNLLAGIIVFVLAFIVLNYCLKSYTNHGKTVTVPTLIGNEVGDALEIIERNGFKYEIIDTVFDNNFEKGVVVEQTPKPEFLVKSGRTIYLTINSTEDEMITMPQLIGHSLRQVNSTIETYGLTVGQLKYIPDVAVNVVIQQKYNGEDIAVGEKIKKGVTIDLVLGLGLSDKTTNVPSLKGLTYKNASNKLLDEFLNVGAVNYDTSVKNKHDSLKAKVYKQLPVSDTINKVNLGYNVDIWLTVDEDLLKQDSLETEE